MKKNTVYSILAALLLAVVAIFFFYPDDIAGNVLSQHDMQQGIANGEEGRAFHEATGETTRWTDSLFGGMPNFQIAPSYPGSDALKWITTVYTLGLPAPANLLFAMMIGFFIMCLCMKMKWPQALLGALAWGFSTYFIIIIGAGHIWKFITLSYVPPTIGGIVLIYRKRYLSGTALAALFGSMQLLSNHPQMSYYFIFVIVAMIVAWGVYAARDHKMKDWAVATLCTVGAGLLALGVNSASLYNSYEYSKETVRGRATDLTLNDGAAPAQGMSREAITAWSYGQDETLTLMIPNIKGGATIKPVAARSELLPVTQTDKASELMLYPEEEMFLAQFPQYFGNQPMTNGPVYVGVIIFLLAVLALFVVRGPMKWALFAVSVLAILLSWGHNFAWFTNIFIDYFPGYNKFRTVSSILVIVEFTIPLLALMCLRKMIEDKDFFSHYRWQLYAVFGLGALICFAGWTSPSIFGTPMSVSEVDSLAEAGVLNAPEYAPIWNHLYSLRLSLVSSDSLRSLIFILLGFGVIMLWLKRVIRNATVMTLLLALLVIIDLFSVNKRYVNSENFVEPMEAEVVFTPTELDKQILSDKSHFRVMDVDDFGGARSSYFHKTVGGYHAAKLTRYEDLIKQQINKGNMAVLDMLNAKYFLYRDSVAVNPYALGPAWTVGKVNYVKDADAEMKALDNLDPANVAVADEKFRSILGDGVAKTPGDTLILKSYAPNKLVYQAHTAKGGVGVFSEIYFPWGWKATYNGKPMDIARVNYVLRALLLPSGDGEVVFTFDPESVRVTNAVSIASVSLIYLLCALALGTLLFKMIRRRKTTGLPTDKNE